MKISPARLTAISLLEPGVAWEAWSLRDVGLFDAAIAASATVLLVGAYTRGNPEEAEEEIDNEAAVAAAVEAVRASVENSPCNGPSIDALEALEAADAAAADALARTPVRDPNELPNAFDAFRDVFKRGDRPR